MAMMTMMAMLMIRPCDALIDKFDATRRPFATVYWDPAVGRVREDWKVEEIPQFVIISTDQALTSQASGNLVNTTKVRQEHVNGCHPDLRQPPLAGESSDGDGIAISNIGTLDPSDPTSLKDKSAIPITFFLSVFAGNSANPSLKCDVVRSFYLGGNEIATNTIRGSIRPRNPQIKEAIEYLVDVCKIPLEAIQGFRAPSPSTSPIPLMSSDIMDAVKIEASIRYDSSIEEIGTNERKNKDPYWPFTLDNGVPPEFENYEGERTRRYRGLWEVPVYTVSHPVVPTPQLPPFRPDVVATRNFLDNALEDRLEGNRAPLGVYLDAGYMQTNSNLIIEWIESTVRQYPNLVYFVTYQQLLQYMEAPVKLRDYRLPQMCRNDDMDDVATPEDRYPIFPGCIPPFPSGCLAGVWNHETCRCNCNDELCRTVEGPDFGLCNTRCDMLPGGGEKGPDGDEYVDPDEEDNSMVIDGGWSAWTSWSLCFKGEQTRFRNCNSPEPRGGGKFCGGIGQEKRECEATDGSDAHIGAMFSPWCILSMIWSVSMFLLA